MNATSEKRFDHDEAENIRRMSPGDRMTGTTNQKQSVSMGGVWVAIAALVLSILAGSAWLNARSELDALIKQVNQLSSRVDAYEAAVRDMSADAAVAAERADKAERSAALSRLYAVQVYPELNRLGYPVNTPAGTHDPVPPEAYANHDHFVEEHK